MSAADPKVSEVGVVRDERYLEHRPGLSHPESPNRLKTLYEFLDESYRDRLASIPPELATLEQLELVHTSDYIQRVLKTSEQDFTHLALDTPVSSRSYLAAFLAVGGCLAALDALLDARCRACFALIRPPGHHALPDQATGFCIFNNLGVTARCALERHDLQRILIVDWDIHHGQGIQSLFYREKGVFYLSTHYIGFYPITGQWDEAGEGEGEGYTVNIPLPKGFTDEDMACLYAEILPRVIRSYRPELILVAAGFDGHRNDPMSRTDLTEWSFGFIARLLVELAGSCGRLPLLFALEGGYDLQSLKACVGEVLTALLEAEGPGTPPRTDKGEALAEKAREIHRGYGIWTEERGQWENAHDQGADKG